MGSNIFVFVVCGAAEHIETLHFSIKFLKHFSKNEIFIVTDSSRNEVQINHDKIFDIKVDKKYNHHQASIYLKTGLYKFLPKGNNYCYLDTDVIAVSNQCDNIFNEFIAPIRFAPDHCRIKKFSAYAVNCDCASKWKKNRDLWSEYVESMEKVIITDSYLLQKSKELQLYFDLKKRSIYKSIITALRFYSSYPIFKLNDDFYFDKRKRTWHLTTGEIIMYEGDITKVIKVPNGLHYNELNKKWFDDDGNDIWQDECSHLMDFISDVFNISIEDQNWQHWNGGVFLFNDKSHQFMEAWFNKTLYIFTLPNWKTRDQGTLIAAAWEFGLNNHPLLSKRWNFIADYNNKNLMLDSKHGLITDDGFETSYNPVFVHVYHNWGKHDWNIWQWIETNYETK